MQHRSKVLEVSPSNQGHCFNHGPLAYRAPFGLPKSPKMETENRRIMEHRDLIASSSPAKLDLSKFPPKKPKGATKHGSVVKIPKKAELGLRNNNEGKPRMPQIVKAPPPSNTGSGKMCGSMAFAQRARGCNESTDGWSVGDVMMTPMGSTSSGGGRFGRLTSIEREATMSMDFSKLAFPSSGGASACSNDDDWSCEQNNAIVSPGRETGEGFASEHLMVFSPPNPSLDGTVSDVGLDIERGVDCAPPKMSMGDVNADTMDETNYSHSLHGSNASGSQLTREGSVEDERKAPSAAPIMVSRQNTDLRRIGAVPDKLEYRYSGGSFDRGREGGYSTSTVCDVILENRAKPQHVPKGPNTCRGKGSIKVAPRWLLNRERGYGPHCTSFDVPPAQDFPTGDRSSSFARTRSSFATSCSSNKHRSGSSSTHYRSASSAFEEYFSQADSSEFAPKDGDDFEIVYRESTDSMAIKPRRHSFGFARRVLGVTVGVTTSAIMLVSGAVVAGVLSGSNGGRRSVDGNAEWEDADEEDDVPQWMQSPKAAMEGFPHDDGLAR